MQDTKKNTKMSCNTGTQETDLKEIKQDLAEMKETLKKIEQLIALLVDILPYKR